MPAHPYSSRIFAFLFVAVGLAAACSDSSSSSSGSVSGQPSGSPCSTGGECQSGVCSNGACGGTTGENGECQTGTECQSGVCESGKCTAPPDPTKPGPSPTDGIKNGNETDVDCGGPDKGTPRCALGKGCLADTDCAQGGCDPATKKCATPSFTDGKQNGNETDVDCGGPDPGPRCAAGKSCKVHSDCESDGCAFDGKCASHPSCTKLEGGYTCGPNDVGTKQNDCCDSAKVGTYTVDKYLITAGRMRAFLDRLNGNVHDWAAGLPAGKWNQTYTAQLPSSYDEANKQLGPFYGKRSCDTGVPQPPNNGGLTPRDSNRNGHVFWTPAMIGGAEGDIKDFSKEVLDTKALNCVPWWLMSAFCVWDGGHLATEPEIRAAYTNNNTSAYPWGALGTYSAAKDAQTPYAIQAYSYATPNPPATARVSGGDFLDITYYIAPPGRRPQGYNATGHADLVGDLLEWVGGQEKQFVWKGSFENHAYEADAFFTPGANDPYSAQFAPNNIPWRWGYGSIGVGRPDDSSDGVSSMGYYGLGGRCAR